jgi:REP-associated tyrosine transposase
MLGNMASSLTNLLYHVVFSTSDRIGYITDDLRAPLYDYIGGIIRAEGGKCLQIGGMPDHVHILTVLPAACALADLVRKVKSNSSRWARERGTFGWQRGYGAFTVSESSVSSVAGYIASQDEHHKRRSFKEEFLALLKRNNIEFDEGYLWTG